jgi:hypothetical protein
VACEGGTHLASTTASRLRSLGVCARARTGGQQPGRGHGGALGRAGFRGASAADAVVVEDAACARAAAAARIAARQVRARAHLAVAPRWKPLVRAVAASMRVGCTTPLFGCGCVSVR